MRQYPTSHIYSSFPVTHTPKTANHIESYRRLSLFSTATNYALHISALNFNFIGWAISYDVAISSDDGEGWISRILRSHSSVIWVDEYACSIAHAQILFSADQFSGRWIVPQFPLNPVKYISAVESLIIEMLIREILRSYPESFRFCYPGGREQQMKPILLRFYLMVFISRTTPLLVLCCATMIPDFCIPSSGE